MISLGGRALRAPPPNLFVQRRAERSTARMYLKKVRARLVSFKPMIAKHPVPLKFFWQPINPIGQAGTFTLGAFSWIVWVVYPKFPLDIN
jgi:hypothetical protein